MLINGAAGDVAIAGLLVPEFAAGLKVLVGDVVPPFAPEKLVGVPV